MCDTCGCRDYDFDHAHDHEDLEQKGHSHGHTHSKEEVKAILNRLSKAIGHLESVKRMVSDGRDCSEVLIQLAAVRSAISATGRELLQSHIRHCIVDAVQQGNMERLEDLNFALSRFVK